MLVTTQELAAYMDQTRFSNRQEFVAEMVLAGLQSEVETILRRPVEPAEFVETVFIPEEYLNGRAQFAPLSSDALTMVLPPYPLALRNSPVVSVSQVRYRPAPGMLDWRPFVEGIDYVIRTWGLDLYRVNANDKVEVTYTAGLDGESIPFLKLQILRAASREMTNQVDDVVGLKELATNDVPKKETGFTEEEIMVLKRWKRKSIAL